MATWAELEREAPDIAAFADDRLRSGPAYMATVDGRGAPRAHPVTPIVGGGRLFVFMEPTSPKGRDLRERGWYAFHNGVPDNQGTGGEVSLRGRGRLVVEANVREVAVAASDYEPADRYILFELTVDQIVVTHYEKGKPQRTRWPSDQPSRPSA